MKLPQQSWIVGGVLLLVVCGGGGYFYFQKSSKAVAVAKDPAAIVTLHEVTNRELSEVLSFPARTQAIATSPLVSEIDGVIAKVVKPIGNFVNQGQVVLILKHTDPVYQYAPVQVFSSIQGIVSQMEVTEGALVNRGQRLGLVADTSRVRLTVEVPASDLASVKVGLLGEFQWGPDPDHLSRVRVRGVSHYVDLATGTATAELDVLSSGKSRVYPGVIGQVRLKVNARNGFEIPAEAVSYNGEQAFVVVVNPQDLKASNRDIKLGRKAMGNVEVLSGLTLHDLVVQRSSKFVPPGDVVEVEGGLPATLSTVKDAVKTSKAAPIKK